MRRITHELVMGQVFPLFRACFVGPFTEELENIIYYTAFAYFGRIVNFLIDDTELVMHSVLLG